MSEVRGALLTVLLLTAQRRDKVLTPQVVLELIEQQPRIARPAGPRLYPPLRTQPEPLRKNGQHKPPQDGADAITSRKLP